jgi:hypothetical protein
MEGPLVYHGRTGHLLLRGISHLMRVRVLAEDEYRITATMRKLNIGREKARRYLQAVEEDRRNWARSMYGVSWEDTSQYDVIVNVERMSAENAAAALVSMSQLPDFQMTPASRKAMEDLRLGAMARLRLARDARTARVAFSVRAHDGVVTVTYLPHDAQVAPDVPRALDGLDGMRDLRATVAATTILWVQEAFDPASETFREVVEIARKWNAAVELVRYAPSGEEDGELADGVVTPEADTAVAGIEDDVADVVDVGDMKTTLDELARVGKAGGGRYVHGERRSLVAACCGAVSYSLVVMGNLFLGKDQAARVRFTRELQESLSSRLRVPVVTSDELKRQYLFGKRDLVRLGIFLALVIPLYILVLSNQEPILAFLFGQWSGGGWTVRLFVAVVVFLFVPIVAYAYGDVARSVMKLIKME